jgi:TPR repeat protein
MSSAFEFNFSGSNYKVDKNSKEYRRLKELFPDCDFIFNLKISPTLMNDGNEYHSVLQFLAKGINEPVGQFIFEKPLDAEVYKLINKLTDGKWNIEIYIIKTYDSEGSTWNASGRITDKGIDWDINQNEDEEEDDGEEKDDDTKLLLAAENGDTKNAKSLIDNGADIDATDEDGMAALLIAAREGHTKTVKMLLDKGANIEAKTDDGVTALILAAGKGHSETVELLLEKGADIEAKTEAGGTPLFAAAVNGQLDCVKMLIGSGANVNVKNKKGKTILMRAEEEGHTEIVKFLAKSTSPSGTKEPSKALRLTIGTIAWEHEREEGFLIVGGKKQKGYAIYENKAAYDFIYDLTKKESLQNVLIDLKSGDLRHADNMESEGSENKGVLYYNAKGQESENIDDFVGVGDTEVVDVETPYGYGEVVLELSDLTKIRSDIRKTGIEQEQCFNYFKKDTNGAKILKLLSDPLFLASLGSKDSSDNKKVEDAEVYYDKGYQFEEDENYEEAVKWYKKAAEQGYADAQAELGIAHSEGKGVTEDKKEAAKWYEKAAKQGHKYAQFCLGSAYSEGEGVPENKKEAAKWYEKAAKQGYQFAQYSLGNAFYNGDGVPENKAEAVKWHRKAADQGLDLSQVFLGWAYENGEGVPENNQEALKWYKLAAEQDDKDAQEAVMRLSNVDLSEEDNNEVTPKGKRITYANWSEFEKEQEAKDERKKANLPIAKKIYDLIVNVLEAKNTIFEIRYGDGTFSLSIPKDKAKSGKRTFARVGLLSLADKCVYLDTLYRVTGTAIPPGSFTWKKNDDSQFLFRIKTIEDFEKVKNSIKQSIIGSHNCLARTKIV